MDCIYCGGKTKVINSRPQKFNHQIWRRRQCQKCHSTVTSIEYIKLDEAVRVQKRNDTIEPFLRDKLFLSIYHAVDHLDNPTTLATNLTATILRHLLKEPVQSQIASAQIAIITSQTLKRYNAAAAIRYLSFQTKMQLAIDVKRSLKLN